MKKRISFLLTMMALVTVFSYGQSGKKYFKAGNEFAKNMKFLDAVAQFTSAIGLEPSNAEYYYARGKAYESLKKYDEAVSDFDRAIVFTPKNVNSILSLGRIYNKMEKFAEALPLLNRASNLDKRNVVVYPEKVITLIGLEMYDRALRASDTAIIIKRNDAMNYYYRGVIYIKLNNELFGKRELEKAISKDKRLVEPRLALAELLLPTDAQGALDQCNEVLKYNNRSTAAYLMRSRVYSKHLDYSKAIDDISKNLLIEPENPEFYLYRGNYYQEFNQHTNAITDFTKFISLVENNPKAYFARARSYEEIPDYNKAIKDYEKITELSEFDQEARKMLKNAQERLYALNSEEDPPEILDIIPAPVNDTVEIRGDDNSFLIKGKIRDKSKIESFTINNEPVTIAEKEGVYEFLSNVKVSGIDKITLVAKDDYNNEKSLTYPIKRTEIVPPRIIILAPYTSDDGQVYLEKNSSSTLYLQGKINDQSRIKSILIDGAFANFRADEINPGFTAMVDIQNKDKILIEAEDIYGNHQLNEFRFNREGATLAEANPMGKTWVVFIENSSYSSFASLDGPVKDFDLMRRAFANYQIQSIIHKKNMTKEEMEKFFSIELRDLIRTNQVKSLLIWYAGHGKFINNVGYWIPIDAKIDDEYSYFNLNTLRASMETYLSYLTHTLVVTDACESGPSFYQAMRSSVLKKRRCDDWEDTQFKSSQVFYSAGYELAVDESQFTRTFATALTNNPNACLPIEEIVTKVADAVSANTKQKPRFGTITGLKDEDGTFFFIAK
jgi:tetratricopeptide (TPR) repeat protein